MINCYSQLAGEQAAKTDQQQQQMPLIARNQYYEHRARCNQMIDSSELEFRSTQLVNQNGPMLGLDQFYEHEEAENEFRISPRLATQVSCASSSSSSTDSLSNRALGDNSQVQHRFSSMRAAKTANQMSERQDPMGFLVDSNSHPLHDNQVSLFNGEHAHDREHHQSQFGDQQELYSARWGSNQHHVTDPQAHQFEFNLDEQSDFMQHQSSVATSERDNSPTSSSHYGQNLGAQSLCSLDAPSNDYNNNTNEQSHKAEPQQQDGERVSASLSFAPLMPITVPAQVDRTTASDNKSFRGNDGQLDYQYQHEFHYSVQDQHANSSHEPALPSSSSSTNTSTSSYSELLPNERLQNVSASSGRHSRQSSLASSESVQHVPNGQYHFTSASPPQRHQHQQLQQSHLSHQQEPYGTQDNYANPTGANNFQDYYQTAPTNSYHNQCESQQQQQAMLVGCYPRTCDGSATKARDQQQYNDTFVQSHLPCLSNADQHHQVTEDSVRYHLQSNQHHDLHPPTTQHQSHLPFDYQLVKSSTVHHRPNESYQQEQEQHLAQVSPTITPLSQGLSVPQNDIQPTHSCDQQLLILNPNQANHQINLTVKTAQTRTGFRSKNLRGRPRKKKGNNKGKVSGKLWEFIRDLLLSECTNPSFIRWERREDGVFKFVQSDKVAKMWGERKQNPKMTYEKLSRAMRYYYKSKVLLPVFGRRLVYKFGPNATGWMSASQQQQFNQAQQQQQQQSRPNLSASHNQIDNDLQVRAFY